MPEVKIDPGETALLLIDMQNDFLHEKGKAAALGVWKFAKEAGISDEGDLPDVRSRDNNRRVGHRIRYRKDDGNKQEELKDESTCDKRKPQNE